MKQNDILYLLNPTSNEGKAVRNWEVLVKEFPMLPKDFVDITAIADLTSFIKERKPAVIAVAGGDGTINSVCKAVVKLEKKPLLTVLPLGFGNALAYCFGVETMDKAIAVLTKRPRTVTVDVMKTSLEQYPIGIFNISVGFDARVVHSRVNRRYIGLRSYAVSAITSMLIHPEKEITLTIDRTVTIRATASSLVVANCPIVGQNYIVSQDAKLNDGLLDCTLFSTKYAYLTNLRLKGFEHPFYSGIGKVHFKAKHVRIAGEPFAQIDGDPVVLKEGLDIGIAPKLITFLCNEDKHIDAYYRPFLVE